MMVSVMAGPYAVVLPVLRVNPETAAIKTMAKEII